MDRHKDADIVLGGLRALFARARKLLKTSNARMQIEKISNARAQIAKISNARAQIEKISNARAQKAQVPPLITPNHVNQFTVPDSSESFQALIKLMEFLKISYK